LITDRPFYFGYQHPGSLSGQIDYPLFVREAGHLHENLRKATLSPEEKVEIDHFFLKRKQKILSNAYRHFCNLKKFDEARTYAEQMCSLNPSSRWKRKRMQASLYHYLPFLASLYAKGKAVEQRLRKGPPKVSEPQSFHTPHPEAAFLQEYARTLDHA
ncbi:hypothetical protein ACFLR2_02420, partial [Chlamydiota bacterium]